MASPNMFDDDYVAPPGDESGWGNYHWEGSNHEGQWVYHGPAPSGGGEQVVDKIDDPGFPGGGGIAADDPFGNYNGGSPPSAPLQAGHGWTWTGSRWIQTPGAGMGYTAPTGGAPSGGGGYTGGGGGGYTGGGDFGGWDPGSVPEFNAPRWQAPPEFVYGKQFTAPNAQELQMDPSFQFRLDQGRKALEQSAAGKGLLRTGGTLKDLVNYGQNFATNEYANVYNRKFGEYKFDYDKEADIYARNYNLKRDVFDRNYKAAYDEYSPKLRGWETNANIKARQQEALFNRDWQKYMFDRNAEQEDIDLNPD